MGVSHRIENDVLYTTIEGEFTPDDIRAYREGLRADPAYHAGMHALVDCRRVSALFSAEDLRALANDLERPPSAFVGPWRCAIVVASEVIYGLVRMYDAYLQTDTIDVRPFRDFDEAVAWLARPSGDSPQ